MMPQTQEFESLSHQESLRSLEKSVEQLTGQKAKELRNHTLSSLRAKVESEHGAPLRFVSRFPFIGRGNVLRDRVVSHQSVEQQLDAALR